MSAAPMHCCACGQPLRVDQPPQAEWVPLVLDEQGRDQLGHYRDWINDRYRVTERRHDGQHYLMISRADGSAERDWRDYQRIKNQLWGEETEAVELYPAESRLVDPSNAFFLWRLRGDARRIGLRRPRFVAAPGVTGAPQRPLVSGELA